MRRILRFAVPYRSQIFVFLVLVVSDTIATVSLPLVYRAVIDDGVLRHDVGKVIWLASAIATITVFDAAISTIRQYVSARLGSTIVLDLRTRIFSHLQKAPLAFFSQTETGVLVSRINNDALGVQQAFTETFASIVSNGITVVATMAALYALAWRVGLVATATLPMFMLCSRHVSRRLRKSTREYYEHTAQLTSILVERFNVAGATLVKIFGQPHDEVATLRAKAMRIRHFTVTRAMYGQVLGTLLLLSGGLSTAFAYGWGGVMAVRGSFQVGTIVALTAYLVRLYGPFTALSSAQLDVVTALVSFDRVFEILDLPGAVLEERYATPVPRHTATLEFDHVEFEYPAPRQFALSSPGNVEPDEVWFCKPTLHDVSFTAAPGQLIALVGPSGAGKTTIIQLAARLYDVRAGAVRVNGVDIRDVTLASLHAMVGLVTQDPYLFHDTIRANLLYAQPGASDADLIAALDAAHIWPMIHALPHGLDTVVGDHGCRLSGGEKQRLAIARVLLRAPSILLLDEATAHLDAEAEVAVQRALDTAREERTTIVVAHRLATVRRADLILVMSAGRVTDRGTHAELMAADGAYARLFGAQAASGHCNAPGR